MSPSSIFCVVSLCYLLAPDPWPTNWSIRAHGRGALFSECNRPPLPALLSKLCMHEEEALINAGEENSKPPLVIFIDTARSPLNYYYNRDGQAWSLAFNNAGFSVAQVRASNRRRARGPRWSVQICLGRKFLRYY